MGGSGVKLAVDANDNVFALNGGQPSPNAVAVYSYNPYDNSWVIIKSFENSTSDGTGASLNIKSQGTELYVSYVHSFTSLFHIQKYSSEDASWTDITGSLSGDY